MSENIVYKLSEIENYKFEAIDCFVCAIHDDERAIAGLSKILEKGIQIKHAIVIRYDNGSHSTALNDLLNGQGKEIVVETRDINSFIRLFRQEIKPHINTKIAIDISCIRIPDMFSIMKILKLFNHCQQIQCVYSVPYDYEYYAGEFSYKYSLGDLQNYELIGYNGNYDSEKQDSTYIVFLGFEGALSLKVLEEAEYRRLIFVNSLPSFYQKYKDISILNNRSSIKGKKYDSLQYVPADNPFEVYNFLERQYSNVPAICISPLGTKPVALGVCLFALDYENVRVIYPISDTYSTHSTDNVAKTLVYEISLVF